MFKRFIFSLVAAVFLATPFITLARPIEAIDDWYIKDFQSDIVVNLDSSLTITETIIADCGKLPGKHGIFRVLSTRAKIDDGSVIKTPIELLSIKDQDGKAVKYSTTEKNGTITWKIGDANKTVQGENVYSISYRVKNAIRAQADFDELYWNLNGNFWEIETDHFIANIIFPSGINKTNVNLEYFSGQLGDKNDSLSKHEWVNNQTLRFESTRTMFPGEGITLSAALPKGVLAPYQASFLDSFPSAWQWVFLPLLVFVICFLIWKRYGDDPNLHKTVIAEYEAPEGMGPLEMGLLKNHGYMDNNFITAAIVKMACDGVLTIKEVEKKILLFNNKDYELAKTANVEALARLSSGERVIYDGLFEGANTVSLSEMKKSFYKTKPKVEKEAKNWLLERGYMEKSGFKAQATMFIVGIGVLFVVFAVFNEALSWPMMVAFGVSAAITILFAVFMSKKTMKGAEAEWRIKGFRLFIDKAEKYRAQFYEKENMFEKILPYAIAFGLTKKWISKMRDIYGEQKFSAIAPAWFISSSGSFDADSFTSSLNSVSSAISSSVSSSSGQGGGGFSGGGGGGGGGGGW
jgi:uncharacterized membrane protein